jgi:3-oxoacyl-[acyl-carrier-protein] synthase-3
MQMDGKAIFKWAVRVSADSCNDVLQAANVCIGEVDWLIMHQANVRIIDAAAQSLGISRDRVVVNLDRVGNTSAASIPLAMDEAIRDGRIQRNDLLLLCGFGAGLTWGTALLRW